MRFVACRFDAHGRAVLEILNDAIVNSTAIYDYKARPLSAMESWFPTLAVTGTSTVV